MKLHILQSKDEQGIWRFDNDDLKLMAVSYFQNLFADSMDRQTPKVSDLCDLPSLSTDQFQGYKNLSMQMN